MLPDKAVKGFLTPIEDLVHQYIRVGGHLMYRTDVRMERLLEALLGGNLAVPSVLHQVRCKGEYARTIGRRGYGFTQYQYSFWHRMSMMVSAVCPSPYSVISVRGRDVR